MRSVFALTVAVFLIAALPRAFADPVSQQCLAHEKGAKAPVLGVVEQLL